MRRTVTFRNDLSNGLQTFRVISHCELHLYEQNRDGAECFEVVLDATLRTNTTSNDTLWLVPQHKSEQCNEVVENLWIVVNFQDRKRIRIIRTGEKNLDLASSV